MNFTPWIFPKKFKLTCLSLRWIWFPCVSLSMISVVFCVFCPWNSFPGFLTDQLFTWRKSYMKKLISTGFQSIDTFFFVDAPTIFIQYSSTETCYKEKLSTEVFPWAFFQGRLWIRFFSDDIVFQHILVVDKNFRGLPMDEIGGSSPKYTSFLALHLYEIRSSGLPVSEMVLVLVSPFLKTVFMEAISAEQTSGNFPLKNSIWSFWNHLNWFPWNFLNQNNFHGIFHHETDFQENFQNKLVAWFSHQRILFSRSCKKLKTLFFDFPVLKRVFSDFSLLDLIFLTFLSVKSVSVVFLWTKFSFVDFSWMKICFGIFNNETDFNGFPNNIFFLIELPLGITCFLRFLNNLIWLRCFFQWIFYRGLCR